MRCLLLFALSLIASLPLSAQLQPTVGVSAGANYSQLHWYNTFHFGTQLLPDNDLHRWVPGFQAGLAVQLPVTPSLSLLFNPLFNRRGDAMDNGSSSDKTRVRLDYLDIPLLAQYYPFRKFYVEGGPMISWLLKAETAVNGEPTGNSRIMDQIYRDIDISAALGLGYQFDNRIAVNLRFVHGLIGALDLEYTDVNGEPLTEAEEPKALNQSVQLSIQYVILNP